MSSPWPMVPLREVLQLQRRWIQLHPTGTYREIGIRSFGNGIFHKAPIQGSTLGNKRVLRIEPGDLVFNNVFAWEGAVAVAGPDEAGMIGSHRFVTYTVNPEKATAKFLQRYFNTNAGREILLKVSPGSAGRNKTLGLDRFITYSIPLPPVAEQRRLVERIDALAAMVDEAKRLRAEATRHYSIFRDAKLSSFFPEGEGTVVSDYVSVQNGYAFKSEWFVDAGVRLARNTNIGHGRLDWSETARIPTDIAPTFARFDLFAGDMLISLDRPLISTGVKVARVTHDDLPALLLQRVGRVQFRDDRLSPDYFFEWLHSPRFSKAIDPGRSNGVPHISSKDIERIPFSPPPREEQKLVLGQIAEFGTRSREVQKAQALVQEELEAMLPTILDRSFQGEL